MWGFRQRREQTRCCEFCHLWHTIVRPTQLLKSHNTDNLQPNITTALTILNILAPSARTHLTEEYTACTPSTGWEGRTLDHPHIPFQSGCMTCRARCGGWEGCMGSLSLELRRGR
jgi:hypothetical protein